MIRRPSVRDLVSPTMILSVAVVMCGLQAAGRAQTSRPTSAPASMPGARAAALIQAEAAFFRGDHRRAARLAAGISGQDQLAGRARFIEGYAHYKLGELGQAARLLARSVTLDPRAQTTFLAGLVAFERRAWREARALLGPLKATSGQLAQSAARIIDRIESREAAEKAAAAQDAHARAIDQARTHLGAGRHAAAAAAVRRAEAARPADPSNRYYRGLIAFKQKRYAQARRHFQRALAVAPDHARSRYMLALTLDTDDASRRRILLQLASSGPTAALRGAARRALSEDGAAHAEVRRFSLDARLSLGGGLDTSPAAIIAPVRAFAMPWNPAPEDPAAMVIRGAARLSFQVALSPGHTGDVGVHAAEAGFAAGGAGMARTEVGGHVRYRYARQGLTLSARYGFTYSLLDHAPLFATHRAELELAIPFGLPWLDLVATPGFTQRMSQDDAYLLLSAAEVSGAVDLRARSSRSVFQVGYALVRGWSDPVAQTVSQRLTATGATIVTTFETDPTSFGHGPRSSLRLSLPWRLSFTAAASLLSVSHDTPDRYVLTPPGKAFWDGRRPELRLATHAELSRPLGLGISLALAFDTEDSFSDQEAGSPVDWSRAQRVLMMNVRWRRRWSW